MLLLVTGQVSRGGDVVTDVFPVVDHPRRMTRVCAQTESTHGQLDSVIMAVVVLEYVRKKPGMHTNLVHEKSITVGKNPTSHQLGRVIDISQTWRANMGAKASQRANMGAQASQKVNMGAQES